MNTPIECNVWLFAFLCAMAFYAMICIYDKVAGKISSNRYRLSERFKSIENRLYDLESRAVSNTDNIKDNLRMINQIATVVGNLQRKIGGGDADETD